MGFTSYHYTQQNQKRQKDAINQGLVTDPTALINSENYYGTATQNKPLVSQAQLDAALKSGKINQQTYNTGESDLAQRKYYQAHGPESKGIGGILESVAPIALSLALGQPELASLGTELGATAATAEAAGSLISPLAAGGAVVGAGMGALSSGLGGGDPLLGAVEGGVGGLLGGEIAPLKSGGGGFGGDIGKALDIGATGGNTIAKSGLGALTSGLQGGNPALGAAESGLSSLAQGLPTNSGTIAPYQSEDIQQQIQSEPGVTLPDVIGPTIGPVESQQPNGSYSAPTTSPGSTNYGTNSGLDNLLKGGASVAQSGLDLSGILQGITGGSSSQSTGASQPQVLGTNTISSQLTPQEAAGINQTGSYTDRQLYNTLEAIQAKYRKSGTSGSPQEQAEIQQLLQQQVG